MSYSPEGDPIRRAIAEQRRSAMHTVGAVPALDKITKGVEKVKKHDPATNKKEADALREKLYRLYPEGHPLKNK